MEYMEKAPRTLQPKNLVTTISVHSPGFISWPFQWRDQKLLWVSTLNHTATFQVSLGACCGICGPPSDANCSATPALQIKTADGRWSLTETVIKATDLDRFLSLHEKGKYKGKS